LSTSEESPSPKASSLALVVLVGLAALSPWPFGSVTPLAVHLVTLIALATSAVVLVWAPAEGGLRLPGLPLLPLLGLLALGLLQLLPLPAALHAALAPGAHAVWSPASPAAQAVLGGGPHPVSVHPEATCRALLFGSGLLSLALLAAPALARAKNAVLATALVAAGGVGVSAYGILARGRFGSLLYGRIPVPTISPFGPFVSKNHFAGYVGMAALLALGLAVGLARRGGGREWTSGRRAGGVVLALVAALAMALGVLVSLSRGGAVSLAAGVLAFLALRVRERRGEGRVGPFLPSLAVAVALGTLLLLVLPPQAHERLRSLADTSFRLDTWRDTLRMASSSPWVGQGLGSFEDAYPRFKSGHGELRVEHAENDYLETLAEAGLLGLSLAVAALFIAAARVRAARPSTLLRGLGAGALAGLVALLVHSLFDFNLRIPSNAILAAFLVSVVAAGAPVRPAAAGASRAAAAAFGLAALLALPRPAFPVDPSAPWEEARNEARRAAASVVPEARVLRLDRTERALRAILRGRPAHAEAWLLLAGTRAERRDPSAGELARHAVGLDPERADLRSAAETLFVQRGVAVSAPP
jgi:O-antigen ligase